MDWDRVEGNWKQVKGKIKEKWGKLTDDDLTAIMVGGISSKGRFRSATALRRTKPAKMWTPGIIRKDGEGPNWGFLKSICELWHASKRKNSYRRRESWF